MSTTPLTDEVYDRRFAPEKTGITGHELCKQLETELAVTKDRLASILWSGALDNYTGGDIQKWAAKYTAELAFIKSEFEKVTLLAAQAADRNVELRRRAEKAEAELAAARFERNHP